MSTTILVLLYVLFLLVSIFPLSVVRLASSICCGSLGVEGTALMLYASLVE